MNTNTWVHLHMQHVSVEENGIAARNNHTINTNAEHPVATKQVKPVPPVVLVSGCEKTVMVSKWGRQQNILHKKVLDSLYLTSQFFKSHNLDNLPFSNTAAYDHFYIVGFFVKFYILQ